MAVFTLTAFLGLPLLQAQENDRIVVPFSNPSGAKRLQCNLVEGSITVKAHGGNDVILEARGLPDGDKRRGNPPPGMRRLSPPGTGLHVDEQNNVIKISTLPTRGSHITLTVPTETALKLSTVNNGNIVVEGINGEIDVNNLNGNITIRDVGGAVVAHTLNGKLIAVLNSVTAGRPMSFSTLNGDVDVTLPASVKANLKMKSDNGDVYTDFEVTLTPSSTPQSGTRDSKGRYRLRSDRTTYATINGGGPDFSFTTLNGNLYIRKGK
ncbi:MAG: DUF4097 family beta strand repeat protein [Bryobacterales bacterium]|nr:DUF4097 family beta strand repeat protein [Bryobacterales bacterium]